MSLIELQRRQYAWRPWDRIYSILGDLSEQLVLDLGCGIGDQAADLARRGAEVMGVDSNATLIEAAHAREIRRARFTCEDLSNLDLESTRANGIWSSFTVAYLPNIGEALDRWSRWLLPGGWLAVTEVDDLLGHEPLDPHYRRMIEQYYARSLEEGLYAFRSRDRLREALSRRGWTIKVQENLPDLELCFEGPADDAVLSAWRTRLGFMQPLFLERFGESAAGLRRALLDCLASKPHHSRASVWFLLARKPERAEAGGQAC